MVKFNGNTDNKQLDWLNSDFHSLSLSLCLPSRLTWSDTPCTAKTKIRSSISKQPTRIFTSTEEELQLGWAVDWSVCVTQMSKLITKAKKNQILKKRKMIRWRRMRVSLPNADAIAVLLGTVPVLWHRLLLCAVRSSSLARGCYHYFCITVRLDYNR